MDTLISALALKHLARVSNPDAIKKKQFSDFRNSKIVIFT